MISALISFLGGSAFRAIFGEISAFVTRKQEHAQEVERMRLQEELDAAQHARNLQAVKMQADMGIKIIEVQRDADIDKLEGAAWAGVVESTTKMTGVKFIDIWNGIIRPLLATLAIIVVVVEIAINGFVLSDWDRELVAAILGIYLADRQLQKRGK